MNKKEYSRKHRDTENYRIYSEDKKRETKEQVRLTEDKCQDGRPNANHSNSYVKSRWTEYCNFRAHVVTLEKKQGSVVFKKHKATDRMIVKG